MSTKPLPRILLLILTGCAGLIAQDAKAQSTPPPPAPMKSGPAVAGTMQPANVLKVSYGGKVQEYTAQDVAALAHVSIDVTNGHTQATEHFAGVLLSTLLTKVGVPDKPHGKDFRLYLVAEGADGYQVVYSLGEVNPDVHDGTVIVADTLGAAKIGEAGPFQLVASGEKRPARWVRNLVSIRVMSAP